MARHKALGIEFDYSEMTEDDGSKHWVVVARKNGVVAWSKYYAGTQQPSKPTLNCIAKEINEGRLKGEHK